MHKCNGQQNKKLRCNNFKKIFCRSIWRKNGKFSCVIKRDENVKVKWKQVKIKSWYSIILEGIVVTLFDEKMKKLLVSFNEMKLVQRKSEMEAGQ